MEAKELLTLFQRGLIPGPTEKEEDFLSRVKAHPPLIEWEKVKPLPSQWGFSVDWVPLVYSSQKLLPWEGALFWVTKEKSHIQLHPKLQSRSLWGNSLQDILHHESIHAAREAFNEPQFEEFLAYLTASSPWKRFLGPLFQRGWEFPLFTLSLFFLPYTVPIPLFFFLRLFYKHWVLSRVKKKVSLPVLICLTDREIKACSRARFPLSEGSLREKLIRILLDPLRH